MASGSRQNQFPLERIFIGPVIWPVMAMDLS
jgi:hypothetical protein